MFLVIPSTHSYYASSIVLGTEHMLEKEDIPWFHRMYILETLYLRFSFHCTFEAGSEKLDDLKTWFILLLGTGIYQLPMFVLNTQLWARGFSGGSMVKNSPANVGDVGLIPGWGRSPGEGNGNPLQYSCLENPMNRGAWWATVHRVAKNQTWLSARAYTHTHTHTHTHTLTHGPGAVCVFSHSLVFQMEWILWPSCFSLISYTDLHLCLTENPPYPKNLTLELKATTDQ